MVHFRSNCFIHKYLVPGLPGVELRVPNPDLVPVYPGTRNRLSSSLDSDSCIIPALPLSPVFFVDPPKTFLSRLLKVTSYAMIIIHCTRDRCITSTKISLYLGSIAWKNLCEISYLHESRLCSLHMLKFEPTTGAFITRQIFLLQVYCTSRVRAAREFDDSATDNRSQIMLHVWIMREYQADGKVVDRAVG